MTNSKHDRLATVPIIETSGYTPNSKILRPEIYPWVTSERCNFKRDKPAATLRPPGSKMFAITALILPDYERGYIMKPVLLIQGVRNRLLHNDIYLINQARGPYWENIGPRS